MGNTFHFEHATSFSPESAPETLRTIPPLPGVFALRGELDTDEPYLTRAADLRRRITRILAPPEPSVDGRPAQSKRLNLRDRVARIEYTVTGSEFESTLTLYHASASIFGLAEARRRLRLHTPFFLRFTADNPYPRVYSTNRLSKRALDITYGPFPSRAAAERYCDAVLDLFKLRRCYEDLIPHPDHPGCVYQEMKKCLAPCNQAHVPEGAAAYSAEAAAVKRFFDTHGESMIIDIGLEREEASAAMEFERAAALHAQWHKVKAAQALADELVQPVPDLRAVIVQRAARLPGASPDEAAVFFLEGGCLTGPALLSTLGVRAVKEQTSVGSSLFAQPLMLQAIPLAEDIPATPVTPAPIASLSTPPATCHPDPELAEGEGPASPDSSLATTLSPELRATQLISTLETQASATVDLATLSDHLSLLRRWYYRPEKQRAGAVFLPNAEGGSKGQWPIRRILNGAARIALGDPAPIADTNRDLATRNPEEAAQRPVKTKVLHEGRPDVERVVPAIENPSSTRAFASRRKAGTHAAR